MILRTWFKNQDTTLKMLNAWVSIYGEDKCKLTLHTDYTGIDPRTVDSPDIYTKRGFTSRVVLSFKYADMKEMSESDRNNVQKVFIMLSEALKGYMQMSVGNSDFRLLAKSGMEKKAYPTESIDITIQEKLKEIGIKVKVY